MKKLAVFLFVCIVVTGIVKAESFNVEGNGTGSNNSIQIVNSSNTSNSQTSTTDINNNVSGNASTGNNSANGNTNGDTTIVTGDATTHIKIDNKVNINDSDIECDDCSPTQKVTPKPTSPVIQPTATPNPIDNGKPNPKSDTNDPPDPNDPSPTTNKDGEILGLAATSGDTTKTVTTTLGVLCLALSSLLLKRQLI